MTRLTSNIARSTCVASCAGGTGAAAPELVSVSGVVGCATGPPQHRSLAPARSPTLKTYTTDL
jgi:hypothetical protein